MGERRAKDQVTNAEFTAVVQQYQKLVYTVCYQMVQDAETAQDLAQETFLSAFTHIDRCPPEYYKAWLAKIAANKARDHLRSAWHRRVSAPGEDNMAQLPMDSGPPGLLGPEELAVSADEAQAIRRMVLELKEPYLQVARLCFLQEQTVDQIAQTLQRPRKTVYTQLYRARLILQQKIQERREAQ